MKRYIKLIACILIIANLTACSSAQELNKLAIVTGVGVDKSNEENKIKLTVQVPKVANFNITSKSGGTTGAENASINLTEESKTISGALKDFNRVMNRKLFFSHNQVIIFGNKMAESGIEEYIDFFLRNRETRILVWILVSNGEADKILDVKPSLDMTSGRNIGELIKNEQKASQVPAVDLREFTSKLISKTTAPIAPIIEIDEEKKNKGVIISESAVFDKGKMVGKLNYKETRGLLWGVNRVKNGIITVNAKQDEKEAVLEVTKSKSKIIPNIKDGIVSMNIKIEAECDLGEQTSSEDLSTPKGFNMLEEKASEEVRKEVMSAVDKSKQLKADTFGFGDIIYQHYPKQWSKMESNWSKIFQNIEVQVDANINIRRSGRITKPATYKGES
ncbi:Ger(x)C family spore germination protein [Clostridium sp. 19966]|uniref:Ger(x)C family spore germination protein n=1 Tax=Clostridium sp. 19966 TaxID=2768166 RepID=UPI0028DEB90D|nr:Ger(x)C family spore germination protein [Clostridium sp. 19966]MDT8716804.1 Ger(x)C family spore germination protein [Clostridium sp. 19966]